MSLTAKAKPTGVGEARGTDKLDSAGQQRRASFLGDGFAFTRRVAATATAATLVASRLDREDTASPISPVTLAMSFRRASASSLPRIGCRRPSAARTALRLLSLHQLLGLAGLHEGDHVGFRQSAFDQVEVFAP